VVTGGRLYLRDHDTLLCYDVRGPGFQEQPPVWDVAGRPGITPTPVPEAVFPDRSDAVFVPTPHDVVQVMLSRAALRKEDFLVDLGSGDGRILVAASAKAGCRSVGYEIEPELVERSRQHIREQGLEALATVRSEDLFKADLSGATLVTLYLGEANNARLLPALRRLPAGARIVSHQHLLGPSGPPPAESVVIRSEETGFEHTVHLWICPLK